MISVIIPSFNSESTITRCLMSLVNQTYKDKYEIIVIDSSRDKTPEIVKNEFPRIKLQSFEERLDPGTARNYGVKIAQGDVILFVDSDCVVKQDWIEKMVARHREKPEIAAVGGSVRMGNDPDNLVALASYMAEFREFIPEQTEKYTWHIPTLNISYKRLVFNENDFFDSSYYPQEDLLFNYRLSQKGDKILFDPTIQVYHVHRTNLQDFLNHQKKIGHITAKVLKIIPLPGSYIARRPLLYICCAPFLPMIKLFRTLLLFWKKQRNILLKNILAITIFKLGLLFWTFGFSKGVFERSK